MDDFASATMLRLLLRGMAARGLVPPLALPAGARVPLHDKQRVVGAIVEAGGPGLLLRLAREVQRIEGEPLHEALVGSADPHDFVARWQRLERYVHARHRVRVVAQSARALVLEHAGGASQAAAPSSPESLAVLGVWIGALEAMGTQGLSVQIVGRSVHPVVDEDELHALAGAGQAGMWHLRWAGQRPRGAARGVAADPPLPWGEPAASVARRLIADPGAPPRVAGAAAALGLSPRTLQRHLAQQGLRYGELLGEVRVRMAAAWLVRTAHGVADIGYLCGYADQAHFTRDFTRRAGLPPARYRQAAASRDAR